MDNLQDLLGNNTFAEPPQIKAIKDYVQTQYESACTVTVTPHMYMLAVPSASLAGNLQLERTEISRICGLDKPLRVQVGA